MLLAKIWHPVVQNGRRMHFSCEERQRHGHRSCLNKVSANVRSLSFVVIGGAFQSKMVVRDNFQSNKLFSPLCISPECFKSDRGSVRLAQSASGSTVYMEPEPIVQLNNKDALLHSQIRHHERRVLSRLSQMVT